MQLLAIMQFNLHSSLPPHCWKSAHSPQAKEEQVGGKADKDKSELKQREMAERKKEKSIAVTSIAESTAGERHRKKELTTK